jgi:hypothetical protein
MCAWVETRSAADDAPVTMKRLSIEVPEQLHRRIKIGCATRGVKLSDVVRKLLAKEFSEGGEL